MGKKLTGLTAIAASMLLMPAANAADSITEAFTEGKVGVSFRLRYEDVQQDKSDKVADDKSADALTLRSRLNFKTADYYGVGTFIEFDNLNALDYDSYNSGTNSAESDESVIKDPEYTQVNQAYISYSNWDTTAKWGKQRILLDNQRFIGGVGWRQNEQTYDALSITNKSVEDLSIFAAKVYNVNNIIDDSEGNGWKDDENSPDGQIQLSELLAGKKDQKSDTILFNINYAGFKPLQPTFYVYNIENIKLDETDDTRDTVGLRLVGSIPTGPVKLGYVAEFATQEYEKEGNSGASYEADYHLLEFSVAVVGVTFKLGNELQGSDETDADDGTLNSFKTPLGTNHAHNGWTDQFLATPSEGLSDTYFSVSGKIPGGVKLVGVYHTYTSDEENALGDDDLGSEFGLVVDKKFGKHYGLAFKYSSYSYGDDTFMAKGKTAWSSDTEKMWLTASASF